MSLLRSTPLSLLICLLTLTIAYIILHHPPKSSLQQTLCIIKPGKSFQNRNQIQNILEQHDFAILDFLNVNLRRDLVEELYQEHRGKPFYEDLVRFMTETGPVQVLLLQKENAVPELRNLIPFVRKIYGEDATRNAIHGSDSLSSAKREIGLFFRRGV